MYSLSEAGRRFVLQSLGALQPEISEAEPRFNPLAGDASDRAYIRVKAGGHTYVLMVMATDSNAIHSTEVSNSRAAHRFPYGEIGRFLLEADLPVPRIFSEDLPNGWVLLEDLGEQTLFDAMDEGRLDASSAQQRYEEAIDLIADFQAVRKRSGFDKTLIAQRQYDADLFNWEFDHYIEWGLEKGPLPPYDVESIRALRLGLHALTTTFIALPQVPVHRDFHAKNLMLDPHGRLGLLDFQDALMGPPTYDLASLIGDAYWEIPPDLHTGMVDRLIKAMDPSPDRAGFLAGFDAILLQRQLKAVGRFYFLDRVKGKPGYLRFIPSLLNRIRARLDGSRLGSQLESAGAYRPLEEA